jgi:hypothetical protein
MLRQEKAPLAMRWRGFLCTLIYYSPSFFQIMPTTDFAYETKCRRCGELMTFSGGWTGWTHFFESMNMYLQTPRLLHCRACKKQTIQEVVSYTEPPYDPID